MAMGNTFTFAGNLTRDPELRYTQSGVPVVNFGVAINRRWQDAHGEWQEDVNFMDATIWNEQAENAAQSLVKGTRVVGTARIDYQTFADRDGNNRAKHVMIVEEVGPSLRWATAEVVRTERADGDRHQSGGGNGDQAGRRQGPPTNRRPARPPAYTSTPARPPRGPEPDYGDEPF